MITATLNGQTFDYVEIKLDGLRLHDPPIEKNEAEQIVATWGPYEATATVTLDRREWARLWRGLRPRRTVLAPDTIPLGRLGGRRAVAIDRVRWPG